MAHLFMQDVWSAGNNRKTSEQISKSLTSSRKQMMPSLFPVKSAAERVSAIEGEASADLEKSEESSETDLLASSSRPDANQAALAVSGGVGLGSLDRALSEGGYDKESLGGDALKCLEKALKEQGEVVTVRTNKVWVERAVPEEPPAFVRPKKLTVGDRVQLLNWVPMGVHGAKVNLFPVGKVTKMYTVKALVSAEPMRWGVMPQKDIKFAEEERLLGVELDGRGPYTAKSKDGEPFPYVTKDSTLIIRFPPMASPGGGTNHVEPAIM